jgi:predicted DNA-binding transcriptional regulator AlpA
MMPEALNALLEQLGSHLADVLMEKFSSYLDEREECHFPEKMNVTQAAELTGYSKNSLYQMHSKGQIPGALKVGGKLMFDTKTLRNWVNNGARR